MTSMCWACKVTFLTFDYAVICFPVLVKCIVCWVMMEIIRLSCISCYRNDCIYMLLTIVTCIPHMGLFFSMDKHPLKKSVLFEP
jgi:hypothetical protein